MREFNLEQALAGHPVCTRDGRPVTQLVKFDAVSPRPLLGVVDGTIYAWPDTGVLEPGITHHDDLIMAPIIKKGGLHSASHHHGARHSEYTKRTLQVIASYREDIKRLELLNADLLEVLQVLAEHDFWATGWTPLLESAAIKARAALKALEE